ncbi:MAG: diacylglycerol kinase [Treponema sp.]|jgi:diacylglycerol kinase family enzyme|nr:diacylglycerol kinase [Treponema sp.]
MNMEFFAESLAEICAHSLVAPGRPLRWVIIANPRAGGFVMRSRRKKSRQVLEACRAAAQSNPLRENCAPLESVVEFGAGTALAGCGLVPTRGPGSAAGIARVLVNEAHTALNKIDASVSQASAFQAAPFYLLITASGDGTSLEALSVLYHAPVSVRSNIAVLRLPMGTGNDGADSPHLARALELLIKPSRIELTPAVRLIPASGKADGGLAESKGPFLAFNILSVGLDAFVTHMTNKMKGKFPGDFYKLWVDIAALLYDRLYTVGHLDIRALDGQGGEVCSFREKLLLLAVGISGHRTYGSQKKILPDDRNVCALKQMSLLRKLALKGLFAAGTHIDKPESILFNARRIEFSGEHPILAQMDGETVLLQREDFPAVMELTDPVIPVLKAADQ